jgi:hypothetical protein
LLLLFREILMAREGVILGKGGRGRLARAAGQGQGEWAGLTLAIIQDCRIPFVDVLAFTAHNAREFRIIESSIDYFSRLLLPSADNLTV